MNAVTKFQCGINGLREENILAKHWSGNLKHPSGPTEVRGGRFEGKNMPMLKYYSAFMLSHLLIVFTNNNPFQI